MLLLRSLVALSFTALIHAAEPYQWDKTALNELAAKAPAALRTPIVTVVDKPQARRNQSQFLT